MKVNWHRLNVWVSVARNERAWLRTYDAGLKTAQHVQSLASAMLATQRNQLILHTRLQAVEQKVGITSADPQLIVTTKERMQA